LIAVPLLVAACGKPGCPQTGATCSGPSQALREQPGNYRLEIVRAEFPTSQKLAKRSKLEIDVRNQDTKRVPNVAVTIDSFYKKLPQQRLSDDRRPVFIVNEPPKGGSIFGGDSSDYPSTWNLGGLLPGKMKRFVWDVTAVAPGPYRLRYKIHAGLGGGAKAIDGEGRQPAGELAGIISDQAPAVRLADDERSIVPADTSEVLRAAPEAGKTRSRR
jgi:hypothetical protein